MMHVLFKHTAGEAYRFEMNGPKSVQFAGSADRSLGENSVTALSASKCSTGAPFTAIA
jgi:hypothetical protein